MSAPLHGAGSVPFARSAHNPHKTTRVSASNPFKKHVSAAVSDLDAAPASSNPATTGATAIPSTPTPDWRQLFGGTAASGASSAPPSTASASGGSNSKQAAASGADSQPAAPATPVDTLTAALQRAGVDTAALNMAAHDDQVAYPGGAGWVNHLITVTAGGRSENIDVGLMNMNPDVAAMDIKRMLA